MKPNGNNPTQCFVCNKNPATIHYTEVVDNKMQKIHLCEECAKQKGIDIELPFSISSLLATLSGGLQAMAASKEPGAATARVCSSCGLSLAEFAKQGRLGCPQCYHVFSDAVRDIVRTVQKSPGHVGKTPTHHLQSTETRERLADIEQSLRRALAEERYEDCVSLRDEIRRLKSALEAQPNA